MKLFISWSGEASHSVANALREWIPALINAVEPWVSAEDIAKGAHWPTHMQQGLSDAKFGIICVTPDNMNQPWVLFEAGALSRAIDDARVCPYLFGFNETTDLRPPLGLFQAAKADRSDTLKLMRSINEAVGATKDIARTEQQLAAAYDKWWPDLETKLAAINLPPIGQQTRSQRELIEEVLETVRAMARDRKRETSRAMPMFITDVLRNRKAANPTSLEGSSAEISNLDGENLVKGLEESATRFERMRQAFIDELDTAAKLQRLAMGMEKK